MINQNKTSFTIPNNIRQIGQIQEGYRIYVEDYVATYLNQVSACVTEKSKAILLLGYMYESEGKNYYFVRGAICGEKEYEVMKEDFFDEEAKQYYMRVQNEYFPDMEVIGWAIVKGELGRLTEEYIGRHILQDKAWDKHLFMEIDKYNCIDRFYICGEELRRACSGYFVFYDKNEEMQKLLIYFNEQKGSEAGIKEYDRTVRYFRDVQGKNKTVNEKGKTGGFYAVALVAVIAVLVMAISSVNNYEKLLGFETTLDKVADFVDEQIAAIGKEIHITKKEESDKDTIYTQKVEEVGSDEVAAIIQPDDENKQDVENSVKPDEETSPGEEITPEDGNDVAVKEEIVIPEDTVPDTIVDEKPDIDGNDDNKEVSSTGYIMYIIQKGDTLMDISRRYYGNVDMVDDICVLNGIENGDAIFYGQKILLPQ